MRKIYLITLIAFGCTTSAYCQDPDSFSWINQYTHDGVNTLNDSVTIQNGNGVLGSIFDTTLCGLNYTQATLKLGQRGQIQGTVQPAAFPISGMPSCSPIVKAYFWCVTSGTGIPITVNVTNPDGNSASFLMTVVGQGGDLCWGPKVRMCIALM